MAHWFEEKEEVKTSAPILLTLRLVQLLPICIVNVIVFAVTFFFCVFSKRARNSALQFQRQLKQYTGGKIPKRISAYKTILSFGLCVVERISGWLGKVKASDVSYCDDDIEDFWQNLSAGRGAVLIGSHLGNIDLLRSLSTFSRAGVAKEIPVTVIMEIGSVENFNQTLKKINPKYELTALDPKDVGPDAIAQLQEKIQHGEIVVVTGDRTSSRNQERFLKIPFLGREAKFPYGIFLITALLETHQIYFVFALRNKTVMLNPKNRVYMQKSHVVFTDCPRSEREGKIKELAGEFVGLLEKFAVQFPHQWYNFFDFWLE